MADGNTNIKDLVKGAIQHAPNMNEAQAGGSFEFELPGEGPTRLRLVSYIEIGKHKKIYNGDEKWVDKVALEFELSGPKHPPKEDGSPHVIRWVDTFSLSERAKFFKLFGKMNHDGTKTHMAEMLGDAFSGRVYHYQKKDAEGKVIATYANLHNKEDGFSIKGPYRIITDENDEETRVPLEVEPARSKLRVFIWEYANMDMWNSLFIDGEYEARQDAQGNTIPARSKNYWQNLIREAKNWPSCPIYAEVEGGGDTGVGEVEQPKRSQTAADVDPLDED